jgi:transposase InsO family protein
MLVELAVVEQRYRAVLEVLEDGASVTEVARRFGVARQTLHQWLRRYAADGGMANLADRSSRPSWCPHQMDPSVESRVLALRLEHPGWGPDRILYQLGKELPVDAVPGRSSVYRALLRNGLLVPHQRRRRRSDYRRWERGRAMQLWQMDVMGSVRLVDGSEVKVVTGIDDHSRFVVCARIVARATARPVCDALRYALEQHGVPEQILTDNGKVFTGRFTAGAGRVASASRLVLFDRVCVENGITHLLTAPYSPTTTGKVERLHKTMRREFFDQHDKRWQTIAEAQAALDAWVVEYNTDRPHRSLGGRPPVQRFALAGQRIQTVTDTDADEHVDTADSPVSRPAGVSRWVDQAGQIRLNKHTYRVGAPFAGRQVEVVVRNGLVEVLHHGVLVATHVQRGKETGRPLAQSEVRARSARKPTSGLMVTRIADASGFVSFAGVTYSAGRAWARTSVNVAVVAGSVQLSAPDGTVIRVHAIRHDPVAEMGAFAVPNGRPHRRNAAAKATG